MEHLLCNSKQQVIADGNPYLRVDCILGRSVERLRACLNFPEIIFI